MADTRLSLITKGKQERPHRILLYSPEGLGKSTFASNAPDPIFIPTEDGSNQLDVARFPRPKTFGEILDDVRCLETEDHNYKTLVIDTLDWAEPLCWAKVISDAPADKSGHRPDSIEEVSGGYGKGYVAAVDVWRQLLAALERVQSVKGMNVILLAHTLLKTYKNPVDEDFDRYTLKMNEKASAIFREWSDEMLFANHETFAVTDKNKRVRGVSSGSRLIYTTRTAAFDAKSRRSLPPQLPLDWGEFAKRAAAHKPASTETLIAAITEAATKLGGELEKETLASLGRVGQDAVKLALLRNWAIAKVNEK